MAEMHPLEAAHRLVAGDLLSRLREDDRDPESEDLEPEHGWLATTAARIQADVERFNRHATGEAEAECEALRQQVAALEAELARLREALRWRTVSEDGLPEWGQRVLVRRTGSAPAELFHYEGKFWHKSSFECVVELDHCWLPVPGDTP